MLCNFLSYDNYNFKNYPSKDISFFNSECFERNKVYKRLHKVNISRKRREYSHLLT